MGRKHQKTTADSMSGSNASLDLKTVIHQHSQFFDKLIELIPAKFYLPNDEKERPWFQGLSQAQKASAKKESRENVRKARRERLDPEKSSKTTLDLLKQSLDKEKAEDDDDRDGMDTKLAISGMESEGRSVTYEELQQRLRSKIEEFRAARNSKNPDRDKNKNNERDTQRKRKRENPVSTEAKPKTGGRDSKVEKAVEDASKELAFSHVKLGNDDDSRKKRRKHSKEKELEIAKKLEEAKNDPVKGESISKKHSWKAATSRAAGLKVHDDPKLIKQSLKKEKKKRQKNAQKWKERVQSQQNVKVEKQQKRSENIAERARDKKMRRIAKREKKLLRPGFEGRKEGFINQASA